MFARPRLLSSDNIRKFVQFQLTVNIVALSIAFIGACSGDGQPLTAVQLLWVNLIMDTFAALALGTEHPDVRLLKRRPYKLHAFIISPVMWRNIAFQAALQVLILLLILYMRHFIPAYNHPLFNAAGIRVKDRDDNNEWQTISHLQHYTMIFNTFVFLQLFNEINSRKVNAEYNVFEKMFVNPIFSLIWVITVAVQALLVEFGSSFSQTTGLTGYMWLFCILVGASSLLVGAVQRLIPVNFEYGMIDLPEDTFEGAGLRDSRFSEKRPDVSLRSIKQVTDDSNMDGPITQPNIAKENQAKANANGSDAHPQAQGHEDKSLETNEPQFQKV